MVAIEWVVAIQIFDEVMLNSYLPFFRYILTGGFYIIFGIFVCLQWPNIYSLLFHPLPLGLGIGAEYALPIGMISLFSLFVAVFGSLWADSITVDAMSSGTFDEYKKETLMNLAFGLCFGCLTGLLSSLIFVLFEHTLPGEFLQFDILFHNLDVLTAILLATVLNLFFVWGILQLVLFVAKRSGFEPQELCPLATLLIIILAALLASLINVFMLTMISGSAPIALLSFCVLISFIAFLSLGLLYWLVSIEASIIANITFWLSITYLARLFA